MLDKIMEIISEYQGVAKETLTPETYLISDLGLNSYDVVTLVTRFEDEFDIEISDRAIKKLQTINDVLEYINKLI